MIRTIRWLRRMDERGVSTLEFALVLPPFLLIVIGGMHLSMLGFTAASLRFAAEDAARCGAIQTSRCTSTAVTTTHAQSKFQNITGTTATFVPTPGQVCGYRVTGAVTYTMQTGFASLPVQLTSTACYPT